MTHPIVALILLLLNLYSWVLIATVILSWLMAFDVVNRRNQIVDTIARVLNALTEPVLAPIRRVLPPMGGLDLSPVLALIGVWFLSYLIAYYLG